MKILWIKTDFLHPTNRGGQIRTLEMLRQLHLKHEIHFLALDAGDAPEGPARAGEYSSFHYVVGHRPPSKTSLAFALQLLAGLFSQNPVSIERWRSVGLRNQYLQLLATHKFDAIVCDFLFPAVNIPDPSPTILFQHNVESRIWKRHAQHGRTALHRWYFAMQYKKMLAFERKICGQSRRVIAVSNTDAQTFESEFGLKAVPWVPTGVDVDYFHCAQPVAQQADLVFIGSMDWMPNIDAALWFSEEILPLIRRVRPQTSIAFVGRKPDAAVAALASRIENFTVTGTVPDVRPWLHGSLASIVPLRIGGGTRLKVYEAMAANCPVVSTTIGAEGLDYRNRENILIADSPQDFADCCLELLAGAELRQSLAANARQFVADHYSWASVSARFEQMLFS